MPRLVRCPCLDATGSDAAVAERYMSPLRLGENPVLAKPQATTTLLAQIVENPVYGIVERANAIIGHFRPVARAAVLAKPRLAPPLLAKAELEM